MKSQPCSPACSGLGAAHDAYTVDGKLALRPRSTAVKHDDATAPIEHTRAGRRRLLGVACSHAAS